MEKKVINRSDEEKTKMKSRLNRIEGQIHGIQKMVEEDRDCNEILIQLSATEKSLQSLANFILENHMIRCVSESIEQQDMSVLDEIISLFKRFSK